MDEGYIKLFRKFVDWEWYSDINTKVLFIHLLFMANWKDGRFRGQKIPRGSLVTSLDKLSLGTGLTKKQVRTALSHLKSTNEVGTVTTHKYTVITIKNWDLYQGQGTVMTHNRHTNGTQRALIEEGKKERREEYLLDSKESNCQKPDTLSDDIKKAIESWNRLEEHGVIPVKRLLRDSTRGKMLAARIRQEGIDNVLKAIDKVGESDYLCGKVKPVPWFDFEWFVRPNNFPKVLEGKYDNKKADQAEADSTPEWRREWLEEHSDSS